MSNIISNLLTFDDRVQMQSLNFRLKRNEVVTSNISNSETPGFRALGFDFEEQLHALTGNSQPFPMRTSNPQHVKHPFVQSDGTISPDVYVRPSESIGNDGNTVDVDYEMTELAENNILYRATVELINRKIGMLRYAMTQGGR